MSTLIGVKASQMASFSNLLVVMTIGIEEFASFVVFECPCDRSYNVQYGCAYLFAPALVLFFIALVNQKMFWRLLTGSCKRAESAFGGTRIHVKDGMWNAFKIICKSLPAAAAWSSIAMLKGDAYTCAYWPVGPCDGANGTQNYELPCRAPKTLDTDLTTCDHIAARNLKADSHMLGWLCILTCGAIVFIVVTIKNAQSPFSFLQTQWVAAYRKAELATFERKMKLRAHDLACELTNEFLVEERTKG